MPRIRKLSWALVLLLVLALAGCNGSPATPNLGEEVEDQPVENTSISDEVMPEIWPS